jgi:hypothetical protein
VNANCYKLNCFFPLSNLQYGCFQGSHTVMALRVGTNFACLHLTSVVRLRVPRSLAWIIGRCEPGSSVGIATGYGLDGPGIESRWGKDFPPVHTGAGAHPASCTMGTGSFPGVKCDRGVLLTTHPLLAPRSWKNRALPLPHSEPQPGL